MTTSDPKSPRLPDSETLRRALKTLEALFQDPSQMERVYRELDRIDAEAARQRAELLDREGIPSALLQRIRLVGDESPLTSPDQYDQSQGMAQANSTNEPFQQPLGKPLKSKGPIAKVAKRLGITMTELASKLNVPDHWNLRNWDKRNSVPEEIEKRLEALVQAHEKAAKATKRAK